MVSEYLGKAGFHVIHAESGTRGLALHGREPVDVVILDLTLPDSDGLDVCRQIRDRSDSPILMLTDRGAREVRLDGTPRPLTSYQFALLLALAEHAGRVMSRDALMDAVKGEQFEAFDRSIDVHVSRIRAALEDDPKKPRRVITIRGTGYVFARAQD